MNKKKKCGYCRLTGHKVKNCYKWISDGKPPKPQNPSTSQAKDANFTLSLMQVETNETVNVIKGDHENWYVDNGATSHVTCSNDIFSTFQYFTNNQSVTTANGAKIQAIGKGTVDIIADVHGQQECIRLCDVWHELKAELQKSEKDVHQDKGKYDLSEILLICKILETLPDNSYFPFKSSWMLMSKRDRNIDNLTAQICAYERSLTNKEEYTMRQTIMQCSF